MAAVESHDNRASLVGIARGVGAGALWGLVFLAPKLVPAFSPLQQTIGRYLAYGVISAVLIAPRWRSVVNVLSRKAWLGLVWLSLTGNTIYYLLLSAAVQMGGIALTSLVIGFLPVVVTIAGSRRDGAVPLGKLVPSLLLCAAGVVSIGWQAVAAQGEGPAGPRLIGLICAIGALASWSVYAVSNSYWLRRLGDVSAHDWTLLTGLVTGAQAVVLVPVAIIVDRAPHGMLVWSQLAGVSVAVAVLASIAGSALWNRMSRLLPLTLVGQMILFETLFALIYGFIWEHRWPTLMEVLAFALVTLSVASCIRAHRAPAPAVNSA